jgi:integrase
MLEHAVKPDTAERYNKAVGRFVRWMRDEGEDAVSAKELDLLLCTYFHDCYEAKDGKGKDEANKTMYGIIMYCPELKGRFPYAARTLVAWDKLRPSVPYPPITWDLSVLIAVRLILTGFLRHAIGVLLAFHLLLRGSELVGLRREDIACAGDARVGSEYKGTAVRLRSTKTGPNKFVEITDPVVNELVIGLLRDTAPGEHLFPFSSGNFRRRFKQACSDLGLSSKYVPHSLRHGGATRLSLLGWSVQDIMLRGRWKATDSAMHYIQSGRAMLLSVEVPVRMAECARCLASKLSISISKALSQLH